MRVRPAESAVAVISGPAGSPAGCDELTRLTGQSHEPRYVIVGNRYRDGLTYAWFCSCGTDWPYLYRTATGSQLAYGWHLLAVAWIRERLQ
jgi:hypothetical protein